MNQQNVQMFLMNNQKKFDLTQIPAITEKLRQLNDDDLMFVSAVNYKDPTMMLVVSLFFGTLGVDRFLLGEIGAGIFKLLTLGGFGIVAIIDWFNVIKKTKQKNFEDFLEAINVKQYTTNQNGLKAEKNNNDSIEEIKKYKQLLDAGIITEEEFSAKKKEIL